MTTDVNTPAGQPIGAADFLTGGGDMATMIRVHDWSSSPLGPIEHWPQSLRSIVSLMLASEFAMCVAWGPELGFLYNDHYARILHDKHPAALGERLDVVWSELWSDIGPLVDRALAGKASFFENLPLLVNRKGYDEQTWFTFSYSPVRDESGAVAGMFCSTYESTERVLIERALRDERERMGQMFAQAPTFMAMLRGPEHRFELTNPGYDKLVGHRPVLGRTVAEALPDAVEQGFLELLDHVYATGEPFTASSMLYAVQAEPGSPVDDRYLDFVYQPIRDANREVVGIFVEGADVTDRKMLERDLQALNADLEQRVRDRTQELVEAQEALRQAQKMEAVGQLTGGIAHDFNNLLTIIKSSTDLLRRPDLAEDRRHKYVDAIADTVDRAAKLTGQLLAFARRQSLKPEVFDVNRRVIRITDMLGTIVGARIRIEHIGIDVPCCVEADISQFETALVNLAVNARDAMDGVGTLGLRVHCGSTMPGIRAHVADPGMFVAVSVSDTGCGIAPDRIAHIFEPFYTTKEVGKGTGLGLSQVFGFAKQSGGNVDVVSEVDRGSTFTLYLPYVTSEVSDGHDGDRDPVTMASDAGGGRRVLVVEDNADVGAFSTQLLRDLGYQTIWAHDAEEALAILEADPDGFDVVFTDVVMPGMNGVELGRIIRVRRPALPVILTSGYSHVLAEDGRHGFELLRKPYAVEDLSRVLRKVVGGR